MPAAGPAPRSTTGTRTAAAGRPRRRRSRRSSSRRSPRRATPARRARPATGSNRASSGHHSRMCSGRLTTSKTTSGEASTWMSRSMVPCSMLLILSQPLVSQVGLGSEAHRRIVARSARERPSGGAVASAGAVGVEEPRRIGVGVLDERLPALEDDRSLVLAAGAVLRKQARPVLPVRLDDSRPRGTDPERGRRGGPPGSPDRVSRRRRSCRLKTSAAGGDVAVAEIRSRAARRTPRSSSEVCRASRARGSEVGWPRGLPRRCDSRRQRGCVLTATPVAPLYASETVVGLEQGALDDLAGGSSYMAAASCATADSLVCRGGIRTHTGWCLRPLPLPLGYRGLRARKP